MAIKIPTRATLKSLGQEPSKLVEIAAILVSIGLLAYAGITVYQTLIQSMTTPDSALTTAAIVKRQEHADGSLLSTLDKHEHDRQQQKTPTVARDVFLLR